MGSEALLMLAVDREGLCPYCKQPWYAHRRDNNQCFAFERSSPEGRPYGVALVRVPAAAKGWVIK